MIKAIVFLKKRKDISRDDFIAHYENIHQKLIRKLLPTIVDYKRNYPIEGHPLNFDGQFDDPDLFEAGRKYSRIDFDVITEITFHDEAGLQQLISQLRETDAGVQIASDEENFLERGGNRLIVVEEYCS